MFNSPTAFSQLYCLVFQMFDIIWSQRNGTYMQFNVIGEATKTKLQGLLDKQPKTVDEFFAFLQAECACSARCAPLSLSALVSFSPPGILQGQDAGLQARIIALTCT